MMMAGRRLAAAYMLAAARQAPTRVPLRRFSQVPSPAPPTIPEAITKAFEDFVKFLKAPKHDVAKVAQLAEAILKSLRDGPPEVAIPKIRGLVAELSNVLNVSTFETRLSLFEAQLKTVQKLGFGAGTIFAASLMTLPASVYIAKLDNDHQISKLEARIALLESARGTAGAPPVNVESKLKYKEESKLKSEDNSSHNQNQ